MIKKITASVLGMGLLLASTVPAFAGITIANTGQSSNLDARINRVKIHLLNINNSYTLNHNVTANTTTGANTADNNTKDGLSSAGNVTQNNTSTVEANTTNVDIDATDNSTCDCDNITVNMTGQNSTANAVIDGNKTVNVTITNSGSVNNVYNSTVNTGSNTANNNTGNGTAIGGDATVWTTITTRLNSVFYKIKL